MQLTLSSPEITCDHCIATIGRTVDAIEGVRFLHGDWTTKQFTIEVSSGALLDAVSAALVGEGYPLGEVAAGTASTGAPAPSLEDWRPEYRITRTPAGADVNYACPCSCEAGFAFDRSMSEQAPESCCCGRQIVVGANAEGRLRAHLESPGTFRFDVQTLTMPWGQPVPAVLAIPIEGAEHGAAASH